ncbi:MAG: hypothetical protein U0807_16815 [Candidatus Binatia bacterium]
MATLDEPTTLDRRDLARLLRVSTTQVDRMRRSGELPAPRLLAGRIPRWLASEVASWLASQPRGKGEA